MSLRSLMKDPASTMRLGMAFLILASLSRWFLHPGAWLSADVIDALTGFLYGMTIGLLLLSITLRRRRSQKDV